MHRQDSRLIGREWQGKAQMKVYCIPGLAFDHRIFANLEWGTFLPHYIDWIEPHSDECFSAYASRMAKAIPNEAEDLILIGHSLGGMLAQEIATQRNVKTIVLISSLRSRKEMPWFFKVIKPRFIHHLFSKTFVRRTFRYWARFHDYETQQEQLLFLDMVGKQSNQYLQWALRSLTNWQTVVLPAKTRLFQIHGQKDRTFPCRWLEQPEVVVPGGGHFMVYKKPQIISRHLTDILAFN